ncbi:DUF3102 domain-containing protein [Enterococcus casseliflavus]|uniref:DUF3102 domain-containing protein n=1 Tax=Enterococcus casseliflavus TaxID=37734 RepID=UPI0022E61D3D|nr:DUF3102 domain-containing protein [Enterococcus casseliflavus]
MQEIKLSSDINVITAEINSYKQIAGQSIWEIGRRLNYVKENDLAHGEFGKWLNNIQFSHDQANKFMKVAAELNSESSRNLGIEALYLVATLPEEERIREHVTSKGEVKTPDEMTVRELQELKKQIKAKDEQIVMQAKMIDDLNEQEAEVIEKEVIVEKVPDDYQQLKQSTKIVDEITRENQALKAEQEALKQRIADSEKALQQKAKVENDELEQAQLKRLQRDADISVHKLIINMNQFVKEQAVTVYDSQAIAGANDETKQKLTDSISRVEKLLKQIKQEIGGEVAWVIN